MAWACRFIISCDHHVELIAFGSSLTHLRLGVPVALVPPLIIDADLKSVLLTRTVPREPYFFFESFFDSRLDSFDSFTSFLDSPGR